VIINLFCYQLVSCVVANFEPVECPFVVLEQT